MHHSGDTREWFGTICESGVRDGSRGDALTGVRASHTSSLRNLHRFDPLAITVLLGDRAIAGVAAGLLGG